MDAGPGYDTTKLEALRQDLRQLNIAALETRLIPPLRGQPERPVSAAPLRAPRPPAARPGQGGATRRWTQLRRRAPISPKPASFACWPISGIPAAERRPAICSGCDATSPVRFSSDCG